MDVPPILTKKVGPLPVIAWVGVVGGAFVVYRVLTGGGGSSASPSTALAPAADAGSSGAGGSSGDANTSPPVVTVPTAPVGGVVGAPPPSVLDPNAARRATLTTAIATLKREIAHNKALGTKASLANAKAEAKRLATYTGELAKLKNTNTIQVAPGTPTVSAALNVQAPKVPSVTQVPSRVVQLPTLPPVGAAPLTRITTTRRIVALKLSPASASGGGGAKVS